MRFVLLLAAWLGVAASGLAAAEPRSALPGAPLDRALQDLRAEGLDIVYSSAIVTPELRVVSVPPSGDARSRAAALLAPHGLRLQAVGRAQYVVVRATADELRRVLRGRVIDAASGRPVASARISIAPDDLVLTSDDGGRFETPPLRPGRRSVAVTAPSFVAERIDVGVGADDTDVVVRLRPDSRPLDELIVAASRYRIDGPGLGIARMTGPDLDSRPLLGDDALRSTAQLPGIASSDFSSPPHLRGGAQDQTLVLLDGYPLRSAYHLPGFRSPLGVIDPALVDVMDVYTGAFPARFGGRMSGVIDIRTPPSPSTSEYLLGIDVFNALLRGAGPLDAAQTVDWTGLVRVGTLGAVMRAFAPDSGSPRTADAYARLQWRTSPSHTASLQALMSTDELAIGDVDRVSRADLDTRFDAIWFRSTVAIRPDHALDTWVGFSRLATTRYGEILSPRIGTGSLDESKTARYWDARLRWTWTPDDDRSAEVGVDAFESSADYAVARSVGYAPLVVASFGRTVVPFNSTLRAMRRSTAVYASQQWRLAASWHAGFGVRFERISRDAGAAESTWEPRLSIRWEPHPRLVARLAWGVHGQPQDVAEIAAADGLREPAAAQRSEHWVAGAELRLPGETSMRLELFRKRERRPQARYENLFDSLVLVPELAPDRVRVAPDAAELEGLELSISRASGAWDWWANYTYAHAYDSFADVPVARSWDQRHAAAAGVRWRHERWTVTGSGNVHSGWPTTSLEPRSDGTLVVGPRNGARLGRFATLDLRATYAWPVSRGAVELMFQVTNAVDRRNPCCTELEATDAPLPPALAPTPRYSLPLLPAIGIRWTF